MFNMAVVPSLLYGLVQMDIGHFRAGTRGRLIPSNPGEFWGALAKVTHAALRAIFPVWRTIPTPWLWWLAGIYPQYLLERERDGELEFEPYHPTTPSGGDSSHHHTKAGLDYTN